ncbi:MAG: DUF4912 domain-containing protein [Deltaproteobacteria bacterium]|nr:DUF4912 domain-containing protein [Deltaproteobacteria bacterium]
MEGKELKAKTLAELKAMAKKTGLKGYSDLNKTQLVKALSESGKTAPAKKAPAKKTPVKKAPAKKAPAKKAPVKKTASAKKAPVEKAPAKKAPAKKAPVKKTAPAKKAQVKKTAAKVASDDKKTVAVAASDDKKTAAKAASDDKKAVPQGEFDRFELLPSSYGKPRALLMPKNPEWLFFVWDCDSETAWRLTGGGHTTTLRVLRGGREAERARITIDSRRYYVRVPLGQGKVRVELGLAEGGEFLAILVSNEIDPLAATPSGDRSVTWVAPAWTGADPKKYPGVKILTEEQFLAMFGEVPLEPPWYRGRR